MDFKLEISRDNSPNSYYSVDLFPKQQLDYDLDFYDKVEIDKVKIPFYTDLRIPLTENNKSAVVFDYDPKSASGTDFPKQDFFYNLEIYGSTNTVISGILNVESVEYNSGEPYLTIVLKDYISKYLSEIKDVPLGEIYNDTFHTTRRSMNVFRSPTSVSGEGGIVGQNPDYSRPISFPYIDFCNDVKGKFGYAARQFLEYGTGIDRAGIAPVFSVKGFLEYLGSYINKDNFPFRVDSHLLGVGQFAGSPLLPQLEPEKIHMLLPAKLLAKQDQNTRNFFLRQSPAWVGTNQSLEYSTDTNHLITTGYFGNMETAGNYGSSGLEDPAIYDIQAWGAEKRLPFYPDDNDEGIRGFFCPKVSFNASISYLNGTNVAVWEEPNLEIPVVGLDKMVKRIYSLAASSDMRFKPYVSIYEDGLIVKKIALQDAQGDDIILTMSNVSNVVKGYSNKTVASAPYDFFDAKDGDPSIVGVGATVFDMLVFETFQAYLPSEEIFINGGSRYSINYFIEPLDGELNIDYVSAYDNANPHTATVITNDNFGVNDIKKAITRLGTPDGASGSYGDSNLQFVANQDFLPYNLSDEYIIQDSILQTCPYNVSEVLLGIVKRFDCGLFYDYDDSFGQHVLRIDPIALMRTSTININQYLDDLKSYKITNQGDKVRTLTLNNKDYGLYFDDLDEDGVTIGSTTQDINSDGIAEIKIDFNSSVYFNSVCGDKSDDYTFNQNFQNGAFSENELGFTPNVFTKNQDVGFRFAFLDKPLYQTNVLGPEIVLKGLRSDDKMITETERIYTPNQFNKHTFNGRLRHINTFGWTLFFEDEDGNTSNLYDNVYQNSEKITQSNLPKIEFNMVVPTSELSSLNFFLNEFVSAQMTGGTIYVKSASGEVFEDYAYLTIEGLLR